jgi:signal peptidase I
MVDEVSNFDNLPPQRSRLKVALTFIFELIKVIALAGITIALIRYYLFKPFYVKGASMEPNFLDHEYLIVDELTYRLRAPERGEVVVFKYPNNQEEFFLKRIIGLPNERIKVADGKVTIYNNNHPEGVAVNETYLPADLTTLGEARTITLGPDEYYVLGDNRANSFDSRRFGPVKKSLIIGRALIRGWPISRISKFSAPAFEDLK